MEVFTRTWHKWRWWNHILTHYRLQLVLSERLWRFSLSDTSGSRQMLRCKGTDFGHLKGTCPNLYMNQYGFNRFKKKSLFLSLSFCNRISFNPSKRLLCYSCKYHLIIKNIHDPGTRAWEPGYSHVLVREY